MNETPASLPKDAPTDLPLAVVLLYTAMQQHIPLNEFATNLGIGTISLRQFIAGQAQRPRSRTLELIGNALHMSTDEVRERAMLRPAPAPRFHDWLQGRMDSKNMSRARVTRETRISDGALRNYLIGQTLPDSDQAQRLADVLSADLLDVAMILAADHFLRNGGELDEQTIEQGLLTDDMLLYNQNDDNDVIQRTNNNDEQLLVLWRKLHPHGRRATLNYIATLLAESE